MSVSQVEFFFTGVPLTEPGAGARTDYAGFNLNGVEYKVGDCAFLYPEDEGVPPYVGRILHIFHTRHSTGSSEYCVEVAWFERRAQLEQSSGWEREVVALEETDINPIGCISGKAVVLTASCFEEASQMAQSLGAVEWLFCRGVYKQEEDAFVPYPELAERVYLSNCKSTGKRGQTAVSGQAEGVADSDDVKRRRVLEEQPAPVRRTGKLVSGRTCVECGATQTPQWREGPAGPKTLCNACGVRYVRAQQRANKRTAPSGPSRASCGSAGRQSRAVKAAKAEAASARAAKPAAHEIPQRPLRQAALMAASKTAQYARTGVFPQSAWELQAYETTGGVETEPARQQPQRQLHRDGDVATTCAAVHDLSALAVLGQSRPTTPNCSSFESSGSLHDGDAGVTVEVVVGPAEDGSGSGCGVLNPALCAEGAGLLGGVGVVSATGAMAAAGMVAATPFGLVGPMVPTNQSGTLLGAATVVSVGVLQPLAAAGSGGPPLRLSVGGVAIGADGDAAAAGGCDLSVSAEAAAATSGFDVDRTLSAGDGPAARAATTAVAQVLSAPVSPSRRSSMGGGEQLTEAAAVAAQSLYGAGGSALDDKLDGLYGGVYGSQLGCSVAGLDDEYVSLVEVDVDFGLGPASALGSGALFDEPYHSGIMDGPDDDTDNGQDLNSQLPYPLNRQGLCLSLAASTAPAATATATDPYSSYTREAVHSTNGAASAPTIHELHSRNLSANSSDQDHSDQDDVVQDDAGVRTTADLPGAAALAAAFCADLAPGSDARELLDALPTLSQAQLRLQPAATLQQTPLRQCSGGSSLAPSVVGGDAAVPDSVRRPMSMSAFAVAAAFPEPAVGEEGEAGPLPEQAVSELVTLGRRASRAATEALAADAALEAANKVLEAHQEAARQAAEAAAANLGRLQERLCSLTAAASGIAGTVDVLAAHAATVGAGSALKQLPSGGGSVSSLIDLRDLGGGYLGGAISLAGGVLVGAAASGPGGFPGCCGFDAGELAVAVHS